MEPCKVIIHKYYDITTMNNVSTKNIFLSRNITVNVKSLPITLINVEPVVSKNESDYVKFELFRDIVSSTSKTYEKNLVLFENGEPEELLVFIQDHNKTLKAACTVPAYSTMQRSSTWILFYRNLNWENRKHSLKGVHYRIR